MLEESPEVLIWHPTRSTQPEEGSTVWIVGVRGDTIAAEFKHGDFWVWERVKLRLVDYMPSMWRYRDGEANL